MKRYVVITEGPLLVDPAALALHLRPYIENYEWDPGRATRFIVVERASGKHVATLEDEPFFHFHNINAYEDGSRLIVDIATHADNGIIEDLYIAKARGETNRQHGWNASVRRCTLDLGAKKATVEELGPGVELPRINDRFNTSRYRFAYGQSIHNARTSGFIDQIVKLDTVSRRVKIWRERGCYPGEAIFVRSPGAKREDEGVLLSVVLDGRTRTSFLLVLDARTMDEIGRAMVPHHIPFGFHGERFSV